MTRAKAWPDRLCWGVQLTGSDGHAMLIGGTWDGRVRLREHYDGEPVRPLLFQSRATARAWCASQHAKYAGREDYCADWRFRPVRILESWRLA